MNVFSRITIFAFVFGLLPVSVFAQPFTSGSTLDPSCAPTDSNCVVSTVSKPDGIGYEAPSYKYYKEFTAVTTQVGAPENSPSRYFELVDLNNDNNIDAVVADSDAATVNVLYGDGEGDFGTATAYTPTIANSRVSDIATADFNGDGNIDIAVSSGADSFDPSLFAGFSIMLNQSNSSFSQAVTTHAAVHPSNSISVPWRIFADDVDGDGDSDVMLLDAGWTGQYLWVFLNDGSGGFDSGSTFSLNTWPYDLSVGDVNADGVKDIVVATNGHGFYSVIGNGDGTFQNSVSIYDGETRSDMSTLSLADMDRDGYDDIVSVSAHVPTVIVFPNTKTAPFFTNTPDMYDGPGCGACANVFSHTVKTPDIDNDGYPDVIVPLMTTGGGVDGFDIYLNDQTGAINFYEQIVTTVGDVYGIDLADLNSDGKDDIAALGPQGTLEIWLSTPSQIPAQLKMAGFAVDRATGYVGIGTSTPTSKLHVVSDGVAPIATFTDDTHTATCDIDAAGLTCSSDERLKKNIHSFEGALEGLLSLTPVKYIWKTEEDEAKEKIGFRAQDIQRVFPELVKEASNGFLSVNYAGFSPLLTAAVKEIYEDFNDIQPLGKKSANEQIAAYLSSKKDKVINGFLEVKSLWATVIQADVAEIEDLRVSEEFCVGDVCIRERGFKKLLELNDIDYIEYGASDFEDESEDVRSSGGGGGNNNSEDPQTVRTNTEELPAIDLEVETTKEEQPEEGPIKQTEEVEIEIIEEEIKPRKGPVTEVKVVEETPELLDVKVELETVEEELEDR